MPDSFDVNLEDFEQRVLNVSHRLPVVVDFWADWCAPCRAITPALAKVADDFDGVIRIAKVEIDHEENMKLAGRYQLRGFPTLILFSKSRELGRFSGARSAHWIADWLSRNLSDDEGE